MEETLYDQTGTPVAYLDTEDENTIWLWEGYAVAYLDGDAVYGWNGLHLGWFVENIMYDLDGYRVGFTIDTSPRYTKYEPIKKFQRFKRFKKIQRFPKSMPNLKYAQSAIGLKEFLEEGSVG